MRVAAQGTGHAATALAEASLHDTILVKTHRMRVVEIDPDSRRARAQAGALWADVVGPASEHGLAALAGSSHDVGVVGYCLGGGLSWLARKHGLAANSVVAVQIVTADGRVVVADANHERRPLLGRARRRRQLRHRHRHRARALPGRRALRRHARLPRRARRARSCAPGASGCARCPTRRPRSGASCTSRRSRRSRRRCAGSRSSSSRWPTSATRRPRRSCSRRCARCGPVMDTFAPVDARPTCSQLHMDPPHAGARRRRRRAARRHARRGHRRARGRERRRTRRCSRSSCATSAARSAARPRGPRRPGDAGGRLRALRRRHRAPRRRGGRDQGAPRRDRGRACASGTPAGAT